MVYFACFDRKLPLIDIALKSISGMGHRRFTMAQKIRSPKDRRSGSDRRNAYHLGYFMKCLRPSDHALPLCFTRSLGTSDRLERVLLCRRSDERHCKISPSRYLSHPSPGCYQRPSVDSSLSRPAGHNRSLRLEGSCTHME